MKQKKTVFISHSSKDKQIADTICRIFEHEGLGCWIAPRDIPYGEEWATEITDAIFEANVMLLVLTENANGSRQVIREINLALQSGLKLIPLYIDGHMPSGGLNYYLSTVQGIKISREKLEKEIAQLSKDLKEEYPVSTPKEQESTAEMEELEDFIDSNIDEELNQRFAVLFGENRNKEETAELSPFKQKLMDRICQRVVENYSLHQAEPEDLEMEEPEPEPEDESGSLGDKSFSLTEVNERIMACLVRGVIDPVSHRTKYVPEVLDCIREEQEDGTTEATFCVENLDPEGNPLVLLHFLKEKHMALINMGFLDGDLLRLSKKPMPLEFRRPNKKGKKICRYRINETSGNYIVDPETGELIERKRYFSREKKCWVHYVELIPGKRYFCFQINANDPEKTARPGRLGLGYYFGRYGLEKNMLAAAEWLEQAGDPESWYYLGRIFTEDPLLSDPEDARYYLNMASDAGEEKARAYMERHGIS